MTEKNNEFTMEIYEKTIGKLQWNFESLNAALDSRLAAYKTLVYTGEQIGEAKKDRANLNKLKKVINDRRLELKKEFCEPYDVFAGQVKELTTKIDEASSSINEQVNAFEQKEKEDKKARIFEWWKENGPKSYTIPIESVFDEKLLNKSVSDAQWMKTLGDRAAEIDRDLTTISHFSDTEQLNFCVSKYLQTLDLSATLSAWEAKKEADRRAAELRERMERERQEREARRREEEERLAAIREQNRPTEPVYVPQSHADPAPQQTQPQPQQQAQPEIFVRTFTVRGTKEQIIALGDFMKQNGIAFKRVG